MDLDNFENQYAEKVKQKMALLKERVSFIDKELDDYDRLIVALEKERSVLVQEINEHQIKLKKLGKS